jgi:transcriptional regulator with XRE-family HTH domain
MPEGLNLKRLRELIKERGVTPRALSRSVGDNPYLVRDILNEKTKNPRADSLVKIANELRVPLSELVTGDLSASVHQKGVRVAPTYLSVRYRVQAGAWLENDSEAPPEQTTLAVAPNLKYAAFPQWLERVVGDSANRRIPDGHYVHVVDAIEMGYRARDGDWVVVERRRDQGAIHERTIKQVEIDAEGGVRLWPRSTNERWQAPVDLTAGSRSREDVEVEIVGLVVGAYDPNF